MQPLKRPRELGVSRNSRVCTGLHRKPAFTLLSVVFFLGLFLRNDSEATGLALHLFIALRVTHCRVVSLFRVRAFAEDSGLCPSTWCNLLKPFLRTHPCERETWEKGNGRKKGMIPNYLSLEPLKVLFWDRFPFPSFPSH